MITYIKIVCFEAARRVYPYNWICLSILVRVLLELDYNIYYNILNAKFLFFGFNKNFKKGLNLLRKFENLN